MSVPGDVVRAALAAAGVYTLYGSAQPGWPVVAADGRISGLLAMAHRAVHNVPAGAVGPDGTVSIFGDLGGEADALAVSGRSDPVALARWVRAAIPRSGVRLRLSADRGSPSAAEPEPTDPWLVDLAEPARVIGAHERVMILAGPGVVRARAGAGLHALAANLGAGVVNTWGAKGLFHWKSRHHWATIGLQADDFELAGLADADLVVATGVDPREAPEAAWRGYPHVIVDPATLGALSELVRSRPGLDPTPPLRTRLAAATEAGWSQQGAPLAPTQATLHYGWQLSGGGLVAADAGLAGFWVARTVGTTAFGMVAVPPEPVPGWAAACVAVARLAAPLRPALAVVSGGVDDATSTVVEFARTRGIAIGIEDWTDDGPALDAEAHDLRLRGLIDPGREGVARLATDPLQLETFVAAAGPITAWRSPPLPATGTS